MVTAPNIAPHGNVQTRTAESETVRWDDHRGTHQFFGDSKMVEKDLQKKSNIMAIMVNNGS